MGSRPRRRETRLCKNTRQKRSRAAVVRADGRSIHYPDAGCPCAESYASSQEPWMKLIAKSGASALLALFATVVLLAPSGKVEARPQYKKAFEKKFSKVKPVDCNICHAGEDKKERNEFGKVFGKSL